MTEDMTGIESSNINSKWLENIYENIKNIEALNRLALEGCQSLIEYIDLTISNKARFIGEIQYKNLRLFLSELDLLLDDISPVIEETSFSKYKESIKLIRKDINKKELFLQVKYNSSTNTVISCTTKPFYDETVDMLSKIKLNIIKDIKHLLYIEGSKQRW